MRYLILSCLVFAGCTAGPISKAPTNNPNISVSKMFDYEGCRVYRFYDGGGGNIYYTDCSGGVQFTVRDGKTSHEESVATKGRCK